jgi:hypothetical protein
MARKAQQAVEGRAIIEADGEEHGGALPLGMRGAGIAVIHHAAVMGDEAAAEILPFRGLRLNPSIRQKRLGLTGAEGHTHAGTPLQQRPAAKPGCDLPCRHRRLLFPLPCTAMVTRAMRVGSTQVLFGFVGHPAAGASRGGIGG